MAKIQPADAILALDIGNTRIGMALCDEDGIHHVRHVATHTPEAWDEPLREIWERTREFRYPQVVVGSVDPAATTRLIERCVDLTQHDPLIVRDDLPLPMKLGIDNIHDIGVDRVCAAAAAYEELQAACAIAAFGTATTVDCVSAEGEFLGGAILPGFDMCFEALSSRTALLPRVMLELPNGAFGRNTRDAILTGVVYGMVGALREIVERFATELNEWPQLVVTGGNAALIKETADFVDVVVPHLTLMGIALAHRRAASG